MLLSPRFIFFFYNKLFYFASKLDLGTEVVPSDKIQDIFLKLWENKNSKFVSLSHIKSYLYLCIQNSFREYLSHHKHIDRYAEKICYDTNYSISATDLLPASEVIAKITEDLKNAETYLGKDPIIRKGPQLAGSADELNIETYRTQRLNYYAVKALLARVYLYAGENESACKKAREVIAVQEKWFPFTKKENVVGGRDKDDRVFSSELLFCLSNTLRGEIFNDYFNFDRNAEEVLSPKKDLERFFIRYAANDYRYISSWVSVPNSDYKSFCKYKGSEGGAYYKTLIPMIRISEMYYIVAEASSDVEEAKEALNKVLYNRGQELLTPEENYKTIVADEYIREFWGEGQLFFYYKRVNQSKSTLSL